MHTFRALIFSGLATIAACAGCSVSGSVAQSDSPPGSGAVTSAPAPVVSPLSARLALFERCTTGTFSSRAQADADPEHFKSVRLVITRIWPERSDGLWLYVEQALASDLAHPYRQRICSVSERADGSLVSRTRLLPGDALRFTDASGRPYNLASVDAGMLDQREGCDLILRYDGRSFVGRTETRDCASDIRGAAYATSLMRSAPAGIVSWDRGFDASGRQVWGATKGGYVFRREGAMPKVATAE